MFDWSPDGRYILIGYGDKNSRADPQTDKDGFLYYFPTVYIPHGGLVANYPEYIAFRWLKKDGILYIEGKPKDKYENNMLLSINDFFLMDMDEYEKHFVTDGKDAMLDYMQFRYGKNLNINDLINEYESKKHKSQNHHVAKPIQGSKSNNAK